MKRPEIRPARPEDAISFYGRDLPWPWFGLVAEIDDVIVGLGGVVWREGEAVAFLDCAQRWMPSALTAHRLARRVIRTAFEAGETMLLVWPSPGVPGAKRWLAALGFKPSHEIEGREVWGMSAAMKIHRREGCAS